MAIIVVRQPLTLCHTLRVRPWVAIVFALLCHCSKSQSLLTTAELPWAQVKPTPQELDWLEIKTNEAHERYLVEQYEVSLDAFDPGERLEHSTLTQIAIDRGSFSNQDLFQFGDELFEYHFRPEDGWGTDALTDGPTLYRVHRGKKGGPDSFSCIDCHSKGGVDGASSISQNALLSSDGSSYGLAQVRSAPHLLGLGAIEALATEISSELQQLRVTGIRTATTTGVPQNITLEAKGISFGSFRVEPDGVISESNLNGIRDDLIVRPFGWKGSFATIREIVEHSFRVHLGITSSSFQEKIRDELINGADYGSGAWFDIDNDGVSVEVEDGMLTSVSVYLALLETPIIQIPTVEELLREFTRGEQLFSELSCHQCHIPKLPLQNTKLSFRPTQSIYKDSKAIEIDVAAEGEPPGLDKEPSDDSYMVHLFSDLKVHEMGPELADSSLILGQCATCFRTPPLWGLASSAPYLHDGRALTLDEAIRYHGGEAKNSREAYEQISAQDRAALQVFLHSLTRMPSVEVR